MAPKLAAEIGLRRLWVTISGFSSALGTVSETGTFKECEAIGVLNRVHEQTNKVLIISSAGNAGRAFLEWGTKLGLPVIVVMPESAKCNLRNTARNEISPLQILVRDAHYPDAINFVDLIVERFSNLVVREGGCFNVARRDSMAVPFLNAVTTMNRLPDWYVQAVGSGTGAIAAWESALRLHKWGFVPSNDMRLLLIQNAPFAPMVDAWRQGHKHLRPMASSEVRDKLGRVSASVLSNATPPYSIVGGVYDCLKESDGDMMAVQNDAIGAAQKLVADCLDFVPCEAASAACAGMIEAVRTGVVDPEDEVLLHLTGGGFAELAGSVKHEPRSLVVPLADYNGAFDAIGRYLASVDIVKGQK